MPTTKYIDHTNGLVGAAGDGLTIATARAYANALTLEAGDDARALANVPVDTGLTAELVHFRDKIRVNSQAFFKPLMFHQFKVATATWTRSGTTITVTKNGHGLSTNDWIHFGPNCPKRPLPVLTAPKPKRS